MNDRRRVPSYEAYTRMEQSRGPLAAEFALQILDTTRPFRTTPDDRLNVLDIGSGYGHTARHLATICRSVTTIEPAEELARFSSDEAARLGLSNLTTIHGSIEDLDASEEFDLVVLDNVYEHLPDHVGALQSIANALKPGGVAFILTPNKLWPIEAHYRLPLLSVLPLSLANRYLRITGRGIDYEDASYAPSVWSLKKDFASVPKLSWNLTLPHRREATMTGSPLHYRLGMSALERFPSLWSVSKALLVVAVRSVRE